MPAEILVNIDVENLEPAIAFYANALELRLGRRFFDGSIAELLGASAKIYLLAKPSGTLAAAKISQQRNYQRHWTPVHLDFVVTDIHAAAARAQAAGAQLEGEIQSHVWGHIAHLADPFGHGLCLLEFIGRGYDEVSS